MKLFIGKGSLKALNVFGNFLVRALEWRRYTEEIK